MDTTQWTGLSIEVTDEIKESSRDRITSGLTEFNTRHLGDHKWIPLDVYVCNPEGQVVAGLIGGSVFDRLNIYALWVAEDLRRSGLGTRILKEAEKTAVDRGCRMAFLDTLSFQAPEFYEKHGYHRIAIVDFQPGVKKIYFQKNLQG